MTSSRRSLQGMALGLWLAVAPCVLSQETLSQVLSNGPTATRINLVFLSEGYLHHQESRFQSDVHNVLAAILTSPPFDTYSNHFNAFAIFAASAEEGSDHPARYEFRSTYFNSTYDSYGQPQLLTIPPNDRDGIYSNGQGKVDLLLERLLPEYDVSVLIVNDLMYGGSGGRPLIVSVNSSSSEIVLHELGHNYSGLGDEYDAPFPCYPDTEEPNTTRETHRERIKWRDWIQPDTPLPTPETIDYGEVVGLFEGAHYHAEEWYRPKLMCKMKMLGVPFCEVCSECLIKSTYSLVRPIESWSPPTGSLITLGEAAELVLTLTCLRPSSHDLTVRWFLNHQPMPYPAEGVFRVTASMLVQGTNAVEVEVSDPTSKVRNDPNGLLTDRRSWRVRSDGRPKLEIHRSPGGIVLSWPSWANGLVLEGTTDLGLPASWTNVPGHPTVVSNRFTITCPTTKHATYYRLRP